MPRRLSRLLLPLRWLVAMCAAAPAVPARGEAFAAHGLPFIRSYSLGDIRSVPRGSHLGFDRFGRAAAIHEAVYSVLNDNIWLNIAEPGGKHRVPIINVVQGTDGRSYYGARGSWGVAEIGADGLLHPSPLVPRSTPDWISTAVFSNLIATDDGVYFVSWNGVVYWDRARGENDFFEVTGMSWAFTVGRRVYISTFNAPLRYLDPRSRSINTVAVAGLDGAVVERATTLDAEHSLVSLAGGGLAVFDGQRLSPWLPPEKDCVKGDVAVMQQLVDGRIALAVTGQGLLVFSPAGDLLLALNNPRYSNISSLANREPGVLWVATDESIDKILYGGSLSTFGEALGLPVGWPIVARWDGRVYVGSGGNLYRAVSGRPGEPTRFELCPNQPPRGTFALAAWGSHLLVGNGSALYQAGSDGTFREVPAAAGLAHLVMIDEDHCYVIGHEQIGLLEFRDGEWVDAVARIPGLRNPSIVHRVGQSVWVEMGGDGVARLSRQEGQLRLEIVPNSSWTKSSWVNVGAVGDVVVLSSSREEPRRFFSEKTGTWCSAPELQQLLDRSPYWIARAQQDPSGVIWATHNEGAVRFSPNGRAFDMDATSFDLVNDRYPIVRVLPDGDVWMYAERSLYHIEQAWTTLAPRPPKPVLVSLLDVKRNAELLTSPSVALGPLKLPYRSNNLSFRFYSDADAWRRTPSYEYRLSPQEPWAAFDGSQLNLRTLGGGSYHLEVRVSPADGGAETPSVIDFEILSPWTRSWPAFVLLALAALGVLLGAMRWSTYVARKRNRQLERLVRERTSQLQTTMARLNEETRNAATLAERNRLANEIHDSVQQGLTGAILQLDTTLKLPAVAGAVRSRLDVVRNMVSYARQEVQNAVWDMESPLLEGTDLAEAIRNLTAYVNSGDAEIEVSVIGDPVDLPREVSHQLLRIAQEATTNAFRHARAQRISIRLEYEAHPPSVALAVVDDGAGFSVEEALHKGNGHLGLRGLRLRAKKIQAPITIDSTLGVGTSIRVVVPIGVEKSEIRNAAINHP